MEPSIVLPLAGGGLIGLAATILLAFNGRFAGISGILSGLVRPQRGDAAWRALFVVGLLVGGALVRGFGKSSFAGAVQGPWPVIAVAGLLVGVGAHVGGGCTSGHGVCGTARLSLRSIVATLTFIAAGAAAVAALHRGGAL